MKILITGATGFIGNRLALRLAEQGHQVHALVRSSNEALQQHPNIKCFQGDITNTKSIETAIEGCEQVYHLAALANNWAKDPNTFFVVNVDGAKNIFDAALQHGVQKVVFTSTADTLGPQTSDQLLDETSTFNQASTYYGQSKIKAEQAVKPYIEKGLNITIVNPTRVFGPGALNKSNAMTLIIQKYVKGKWKFIPGTGLSVGNYAYVEDIVTGHLQAMEKGRAGERYALGGENITFSNLFTLMGKVSEQQYRLYKLPMWLMLSAATLMHWYASIFKRPPLITPPWVKKYDEHRGVDLSKAQQELGYTVTPLHEALRITIEWVRQQK